MAAVASVLYIAVWAGQTNTVALARERAELIVGLVDDRLHQRLDPARDQVRFLADAIVHQNIDPLTDRRFVDLAAGTLAATPQVTAVAFVAVDRMSVRVFRSTRSGYDFQVQPETDPFFPELYAAAAAARQPFWGDIVWNEAIRQPLINLRAPVRDGDRVLGVLLVVVSVADLSLVLGDVAEQFDATAFILVERERVLAHPALVFGFRDGSSVNPLPALDEIGDPRLATIWDRGSLIDEVRSQRILGGRGHIARYGGDTYLYVYREIARYGGRPWLIGTYMRETTLEAALERMWQAAAIGVAILLVAVFAAMAVGRGLPRKLRDRAAAAAAVKELEFGHARHVGPSRLRELDDAASAFNAMLDGLRWFEAYVPRGLVRRLIRLGGGRPIESLQRDLTVMFTDIRSFTTLSETMSAAEVAEFLNHHFGLVDGCIDRLGGTVDKHLGDGVMAFWGAPEATDGHAELACAAALAIRDAIDADNRVRIAAGLPPVRLRIGIHTGPVTAGNIGAANRLSYTIVGDTVNTTDRLCELGKEIEVPQGEVVILVSAATAQLVGERFLFVPAGVHVLRGRQGPVEVLYLTGERARGHGAEALAPGQALG